MTQTHSDRPRRIAFLVVPDFSMVGFLCALAVFRNANQLAGDNAYELSVVSIDGDPVTASAGITVAPDGGIPPELPPDLVFVCSGDNPAARYSKQLGGWLRRVSRQGTALGAISTGADLLARAGLLTRHRCTIYWEQAAAFAEAFPEIELTDHIYEIDRDRFTCGGGTSAIDLCLRIVAQDLGEEIAAAISATFVLDRVRNAEEPQRRVESAHPSSGGGMPRKLATAIAAMEANIEVPLRLAAVAETAGLGERHLTRLMREHLDASPSAFYLRLRLTRARQLLLQTSMSAQEVAIACGFRSAAHFSSAYHRQFGLAPRQERLRQS
ncbi:MAG: GlxA family transcriptional regulator [Neomegalonema sp.]